MRVLLDYRERAFYETLLRVCNSLDVDLNVTNLRAGDVAISGNGVVLIERKTPSDFIASIRNNRLFEQMIKLLSSEMVEGEEVKRSALLVDGELFGGFENNSQIYGALMEINFVYNIPVFMAPTNSEMEDFFATLIKREMAMKNDKEMAERWFRPGKGLPQKNPRTYLLASIPMVGEKLAKKLLDRFGTISNVADASVERLQETELIGKKKAKKIYEIFHEKD